MGGDVTSARSTDVLRMGLRHGDDGTISTVGSGKFSLTQPKAPHFATTDRLGDLKDVHKSKAKDVSLAMSTNADMSGLRHFEPVKAVKRPPGGLSVPQAPKFHAIAKRKLPQSTEERGK